MTITEKQKNLVRKLSSDGLMLIEKMTAEDAQKFYKYGNGSRTEWIDAQLFLNDLT